MKQKIFLQKIVAFADKIGVWLLGLIAIIFNISLAFDNVVWGDEAYSQMAIINTNLHGVYERVYYWDSHPPLYYYYLKFLADIFGYHTPVYHIASIIPFAIGIIFACTLVRKHLGVIPAIFFILISGFSESCVEYNLEIRMYSLVFMFVLLSACYAYLIVKNGFKVSYFVLMTLFGELAAYTHYYGLALCGLIIFFAGLFAFVSAKVQKNGVKNAVLAWVISTLLYIAFYIPWLFVLYHQTQAELNDSWMTEPAPFSQVLSFVLGGARLKPILLPFIVIMTIIMVCDETGFIKLKKGTENGEVILKFSKPSAKNWSAEFKGLLLMYASTIGLLGFGYGVSYAFHPILAFRYTYVLIPIALFILMICIGRLWQYAQNSSSQLASRVCTIVLALMMLVVMLFSLLDFKYFRSVTKTQDFQTQRVLDIVGTPNEDAILVSNGVKHLAWSVLPYYYTNEVTMSNPDTLTVEPSEFWAFIGYEYDSDVLDAMANKGYQMDSYMDMWLGKYAINLYHFYK